MRLLGGLSIVFLACSCAGSEPKTSASPAVGQPKERERAGTGQRPARAVQPTKTATPIDFEQHLAALKAVRTKSGCEHCGSISLGTLITEVSTKAARSRFSCSGMGDGRFVCTTRLSVPTPEAKPPGFSIYRVEAIVSASGKLETASASYHFSKEDMLDPAWVPPPLRRDAARRRVPKGRGPTPAPTSAPSASSSSAPVAPETSR